jgi:hypothetical protein
MIVEPPVGLFCGGSRVHTSTHPSGRVAKLMILAHDNLSTHTVPAALKGRWELAGHSRDNGLQRTGKSVH